MIPLENCDYYIRMMKLPEGVHAMVIPNDDTTFSVYLDCRRTRSQQISDLKHEIDHIEHDDFYNDKSILEVEGRTQ